MKNLKELELGKEIEALKKQNTEKEESKYPIYYKLKKDVLIVDLPQEVQNFKEVIITNNVLFADGKGNRTCLFIIFRDKLDNEGLNEYLKKCLKRIVLDYIEGEFEYKCRGSELTEEIASELVEESYSKLEESIMYRDYMAKYDDEVLYEALDSFKSAIESKGFFWMENPISLERVRIYESVGDTFKSNGIKKIWKEAEEKTFRNPLIFVKKS